MLRLITAVLIAGQIMLSGSLPAYSFIFSTQQNWEQFYEKAGNALDRHDYASAEFSIRSCLSSTGGSIHKQILALELLADLYEAKANIVQEEAVVNSMLQLMQKVPYPPSLQGATCLKLSELNCRLKRYEAAENCARQAVLILTVCFGSDAPEVAVALNNQATAEAYQNKLVQAKNHFGKALDIIEAAYGSENELYGMTAMNIADVCKRLDNRNVAGIWYRKAAKCLNACRGPNDPDAQEATRQFSTMGKEIH